MLLHATGRHAGIAATVAHFEVQSAAGCASIHPCMSSVLWFQPTMHYFKHEQALPCFPSEYAL
jgi:hypothetical protein